MSGETKEPGPEAPFKATEKDVDPEATVTRLVAHDDDATVVKRESPGAPASAAKLAVDDEATRLAPRTAPAVKPAVKMPAPAAAPWRPSPAMWLLALVVVAVVVVIAVWLGSSAAHPEQAKPLRPAAEKAEKRSTLKSLFDW